MKLLRLGKTLDSVVGAPLAHVTTIKEDGLSDFKYSGFLILLCVVPGNELNSCEV